MSASASTTVAGGGAASSASAPVDASSASPMYVRPSFTLAEAEALRAQYLIDFDTLSAARQFMQNQPDLEERRAACGAHALLSDTLRDSFIRTWQASTQHKLPLTAPGFSFLFTTVKTAVTKCELQSLFCCSHAYVLDACEYYLNQAPGIDNAATPTREIWNCAALTLYYAPARASDDFSLVARDDFGHFDSDSNNSNNNNNSNGAASLPPPIRPPRETIVVAGLEFTERECYLQTLKLADGATWEVAWAAFGADFADGEVVETEVRDGASLKLVSLTQNICYCKALACSGGTNSQSWRNLSLALRHIEDAGDGDDVSGGGPTVAVELWGRTQHYTITELQVLSVTMNIHQTLAWQDLVDRLSARGETVDVLGHRNVDAVAACKIALEIPGNCRDLPTLWERFAHALCATKNHADPAYNKKSIRLVLTPKRRTTNQQQERQQEQQTEKRVIAKCTRMRALLEAAKLVFDPETTRKATSGEAGTILYYLANEFSSQLDAKHGKSDSYQFMRRTVVLERGRDGASAVFAGHPRGPNARVVTVRDLYEKAINGRDDSAIVLYNSALFVLPSPIQHANAKKYWLFDHARDKLYTSTTGLLVDACRADLKEHDGRPTYKNAWVALANTIDEENNMRVASGERRVPRVCIGGSWWSARDLREMARPDASVSPEDE